MNSKLHPVCYGKGKPVLMLLSEGQLSDHIGAKLLYPHLPPATHLIGDKRYDSDEFHKALKAKKIKACIPPRSNRNVQHKLSKQLYKQRHKVECMFGKLKDWRRIATSYDRCAHTFFSAICIAAAFIFDLKEWVLSIEVCVVIAIVYEYNVQIAVNVG